MRVVTTATPRAACGCGGGMVKNFTERSWVGYHVRSGMHAFTLVGLIDNRFARQNGRISTGSRACLLGLGQHN